MLRCGQVSTEYFDKYLFEAQPVLLRRVAAAMVSPLLTDTVMVAGLELGGIPVATMVSSLTGIPTLFVRKQPQTYGTRRVAEGAAVASAVVTLIEDVITTGGAVRDAATALRAQGATVAVNGVQSIEALELAEYPGVYCVLRHGQVLISVPAELVEPINEFGVTTTTAVDPTWWRRHLPTWVTLKPSVHAFTDQEPRLVELDAVEIRPTRLDDLKDLQASVPSEESAESGFAGPDVAKVGRATDADGVTIAAANLTPFAGVSADVGVLTRPGFRGRRLAASVAAAAVQHAVRFHRIARSPRTFHRCAWLTLSDSTATACNSRPDPPPERPARVGLRGRPAQRSLCVRPARRSLCVRTTMTFGRVLWST